MQYVIGNWKMHTTVNEAVALAGRIEDGIEDLAKEHPLPEIIICPPFTSLSAVGDVIQSRSLRLGAQNAHWADHGAYTGEVSAEMLKDLVGYVIVGHSERRQMGETNEIVARKVHAVAKAGLQPILCVGETKKTAKAHAEIDKQLRESLAEVDPGSVGGLLIAYEPVWAIGTDDPVEVGHLGDVIETITKTAEAVGVSEPHALYGGSVNQNTVGQFVGVQDLAGLLVGGASLSEQDFVSIVSTVVHSE